ncbi:hypothetical protein ONZ45_g11717 [Pleurotus djamor]|nr:hypothetical protein ONZ45_g11717 [Pleurotus djamor]
MKLIFSKDDPQETTISYENGPEVYHIDTPFRWIHSRVTSISKLGAKGRDANLLAEIEWSNLGIPKIKYGGRALKSTEFFKRAGVLWGDRQFTAPDGQEYRWTTKAGASGPKACTSALVRNDASDTVIAKYHFRSYGIVGSKHPAYLEIFPEGQHMMDLIVITFVYVEARRRQDQEAAVEAATAAV